MHQIALKPCQAKLFFKLRGLVDLEIDVEARIALPWDAPVTNLTANFWELREKRADGRCCKDNKDGKEEDSAAHDGANHSAHTEVRVYRDEHWGTGVNLRLDLKMLYRKTTTSFGLGPT